MRVDGFSLQVQQVQSRGCDVLVCVVLFPCYANAASYAGQRNYFSPPQNTLCSLFWCCMQVAIFIILTSPISIWFCFENA